MGLGTALQNMENQVDSNRIQNDRVAAAALAMGRGTAPQNDCAVPAAIAMGLGTVAKLSRPASDAQLSHGENRVQKTPRLGMEARTNGGRGADAPIVVVVNAEHRMQTDAAATPPMVKTATATQSPKRGQEPWQSRTSFASGGSSRGVSAAQD